MIFKERQFECTTCGKRQKVLCWDGGSPEPCCGAWEETSLTLTRNRGVIDDQLEGGARWCETMDDKPVWLDGTKSQWRREMEKRGLVNVVRRDDSYYRTQRKRHDEELRDTGRNREY